MKCEQVCQMALSLIEEATKATFYNAQMLGLTNLLLGEFFPAYEAYELAQSGLRVPCPQPVQALTQRFPFPDCFTPAFAFRLAARLISMDLPERAKVYETRADSLLKQMQENLPAAIAPVKDCYANL